MLEQMKSVSNPLTIIALFAALAEVAGTIAIKLVAPDMQSTFIWFVMIFPILIVVLFFITLNFNAKVLYAPGDFKNDENYLAAMNAKQSLGIEKVQTMIATAKTEIIGEVMKTIPNNDANDRNKVEKIINEKLQPVQDAVEDVKVSWKNAKARGTRVVSAMLYEPSPLTIAEIASKTREPAEFVRRVLEIFAGEGVVKGIICNDGETRFVITSPEEEEEYRKAKQSKKTG